MWPIILPKRMHDFIENIQRKKESMNNEPNACYYFTVLWYIPKDTLSFIILLYILENISLNDSAHLADSLRANIHENFM